VDKNEIVGRILANVIVQGKWLLHGFSGGFGLYAGIWTASKIMGW